MFQVGLVAEWLHFRLFGDNRIPYKTETVHLFGRMNSETKIELPSFGPFISCFTGCTCAGPEPISGAKP